jgi:hypothetical protein
MLLWIYFEAFLKHFSITSRQKRTCTGLFINYAALDLFWSISEALFNHISARKDMYRSFFINYAFGSILKHFWSTFQSHLMSFADIWLKSAWEMIQKWFNLTYWKYVSPKTSSLTENLICKDSWDVVEKCLRNDPKLHILPLTLTVKKLRLAAGRWQY